MWNLQAFDPSFAMRNKEAAAECMKSVLHKLIDVTWKKECECDMIMNQFRQLLVILDKDNKSECECFSVEERLDSFFYSVDNLITTIAFQEGLVGSDSTPSKTVTRSSSRRKRIFCQ